MPSPSVPVLGPSTLNRKWILEVNTSATGTPAWVAVGGMTNFTPVTDSANWVDDSDFSSQGFSSQAKTGAAWSASCTVVRKVQQGALTSYDVGQEYLRTRAIGKFGPSNSANLRFYEYDTSDPTGVASPRIEAYMGYAGVEWAEQGGDDKALSTVNVTLNGQGKLNQIAHPYPAA